MPSGSFIGAKFSLQSIAVAGAATLRLRFTNDPLTANPSGTHDALNVSNYTLTGPGVNTIKSVSVVSSDPQSVDLELAAPLTAGAWTVAAVNIRTALGTALTAPTSLSISVPASITSAPPDLSGGAVTDTPEDILRRHLPSAFSGKGWNALISSLSVGDVYNKGVAEAAFEQLFKSTASGKYLDRHAADDGLIRPADIGMSDDVFRKLAIKTTSHKQTVHIISEILEAFYGAEATRAFSVSAAEPYALEDGDDLTFTVDGNKHTAIFRTEEFTQIGAATATEVAASITRSLRASRLTAFAVPYLDPSDGKRYVRLFSGSLGLSGSVKVEGGRALRILSFPSPVHPLALDGPQAGTQFNLSLSASTVRFTHAAGPNPDLQEVFVGDSVLLYDTSIPSALRGTYTVTATSPTYFEIGSTLTSWPISANLVSSLGVRFYRPIKSTVQSSGRMAIATQGDPGAIEVVLPATTQVVERAPNSGAYLHGAGSIQISGATRTSSGAVTVNTASPHGLLANSLVFIDGLYPTLQGVSVGWSDVDGGATTSVQASETAAVTLLDGRILQSGGTIAGAASKLARIYDPSTDTWSSAGNMNIARTGHTLTLLQNGRVLATGGYVADSYLHDTWVWDGTNWARQILPISPPERTGCTFVALGKPTVFGGANINGSFNDTWEGDGTGWNQLTPLTPPPERFYHSMAKADTRIVLFGGIGGAGDLDDTWEWDNSDWTNKAPATTPDARFNHAMADFGTKAIMFGGNSNLFGYLNDTWEWDGNDWTDKNPATKPSTRSQHAMATLGAKTVMFGGYNGAALGDTWEWDGTDWTLLAPATSPPARRMHSMATRDTKVVLFGGVASDGSALNDTWEWDGVNWTLMAPSNKPPPRWFSAMATVDAKVVIFGGYGADDGYARSSEIYDPASNTWSPTGTTIGSHYLHAATRLPNGKVLVMGGQGGAELYDPSAGTFSLSSQPSVLRSQATATSLPDGRVLMAGGWQIYPYPESLSEVYNPINNTWSPTSSGPARYGHSAALVGGLVMIAGGMDGGVAALSTTKVFNPATLGWSSGPANAVARFYPTMQVMNDGRVFLTGDEASKVVEIYDPVTSTWSAVASSAFRHAAAATIDLNGRVLIVGGDATHAEVYRYASSTLNSGRLNGVFKIDSVTPNTLTFQSDVLAPVTCGAGGTVTPYRTPTNSHQGPFVYDEKKGLAVTGVETSITQNIDANRQYSIITVADASKFPDEEGYLVFGFGSEGQVGPIRYLNRASNTSLLLDHSASFPTDLSSGTSVVLLAQRGAWAPDSATSVGSFYATAIASGRVAAEKKVEDLTAAGVKLVKTVVYPSDVGLGNAGYPASGSNKLSDKVSVWGGDDVDVEIDKARGQ